MSLDCKIGVIAEVSSLRERPQKASVYHFDPYEQETRCKVANGSLLSFFYGSSLSPGRSGRLGQNHSEMERCLSSSNSPHPGVQPDADRAIFRARSSSFKEPPTMRSLDPSEEEISTSDWITSMMPTNVVKPVIGMEPTVSTVPSHESNSDMAPLFIEEKCLEGSGSSAFHLNECIDTFKGDSSVEVPFSNKVKEVRQRIREQLFVHRELEKVLHQVELVEEEANIFRTTHEIGVFMSSISRPNAAEGMLGTEGSKAFQCSLEGRNGTSGKMHGEALKSKKESTLFVPFAKIFEGRQQEAKEGDSPNDENGGTGKVQMNSPTPPPKNLLAEVLERFRKKDLSTVKPSDLVKNVVPPLPASVPLKPSADICRPEPKPVPYRRVVFIRDSLSSSSLQTRKKEKRKEKRHSYFPLEAEEFDSMENNPTAHGRKESLPSNYSESFTVVSSSALSYSVSQRSTRTASEVSVEIEEDFHSTTNSMSIVRSSSSLSTDLSASLETGDCMMEIDSIKTLRTELTSSVSVKTEGNNALLSSHDGNNEIVDEIEETIRSSLGNTPQATTQKSERHSSGIDSSTPFRESFDGFLAHFQKVCQQANELIFSLAQTESLETHSRSWKQKSAQLSLQEKAVSSALPPSLPELPPSGAQARNTEPSEVTMKGNVRVGMNESWVTSLTRDLRDIAKLKRFTKRLQNTLKIMDTQRRVRGAKKKVLEKAQKLSQAREQLKRNPKARIRDVLPSSDIEDLVDLYAENNEGVSGLEIDDEIESLGEFSQMDGSKVSGTESIADELSFSKSLSASIISGDVVDEAGDDWDNDLDRRANFSRGGEVDVSDDVSIDELSDNLLLKTSRSEDLLDEIEEEFAERLAVASSVSDLMDDVNLPSVQSSRLHSETGNGDSMEVSDNVKSNEESGGTFITESTSYADESVHVELESSVSDPLDERTNERNSEEKGTRTPRRSGKHSASSSLGVTQLSTQEIHSVADVAVTSSDSSFSDSPRTDGEHMSSPSTSTSSRSTRSDSSHSSEEEINSSNSSSPDTLAEAWLQTKHRRRRALQKVRGGPSTFTELYDPTVSSSEFSSSSTSLVSSFASSSSLPTQSVSSSN